MTEDKRSLELEIVVPGTPDEVWRAIATGPGISSWYVPHVVEERAGGAAMASFGPGMDAPGRVAAWEPPHRIVFDGGEGDDGMTFEWLVEERRVGSCVVRLINSGFESGQAGDDHFEQMRKGWQLFLRNLQLHCTHFAGQTATAMLPMAMWSGPQEAVWGSLLRALGFPAAPAVGERVATRGDGTPTLIGTVVESDALRLIILVEEPAPGTAFVAAEGQGDEWTVSVWSYLYGDAGKAAANHDDPHWRQWLSDHTAT